MKPQMHDVLCMNDDQLSCVPSQVISDYCESAMDNVHMYAEVPNEHQVGFHEFFISYWLAVAGFFDSEWERYDEEEDICVQIICSQ
jgi:hypothetical protein